MSGHVISSENESGRNERIRSPLARRDPDKVASRRKTAAAATVINQLDKRLSEHMESFARDNSLSPSALARMEKSKSKANNDNSVEKRKSLAAFRTTGEQVGHLLYRKSTIVKSHKKAVGLQHKDEGKSNIALDGSRDEAMQRYKSKEAREYFASQKEAAEKDQFV